jgi:hypothetical protein
MLLFRVLVRVGAVLCLLIAAVVVGAGAGEYPGLTRAGLRFATTEILPLVVVAVANLAALDGPRVGTTAARWLHWIAPAANVALLADALPDARRGAPPVVWATIASAAVLVVASVGWALTRRRGGTPRTTGSAS